MWRLYRHNHADNGRIRKYTVAIGVMYLIQPSAKYLDNESIEKDTRYNSAAVILTWDILVKLIVSFVYELFTSREDNRNNKTCWLLERYIIKLHYSSRRIIDFSS